MRLVPGCGKRLPLATRLLPGSSGKGCSWVGGFCPQVGFTSTSVKGARAPAPHTLVDYVLSSGGAESPSPTRSEAADAVAKKKVLKGSLRRTR